MSDKAELLRTLQMVIDRSRQRGMCLDCGAQLDDYRAPHDCTVDRVHEVMTAMVPWIYQGDGSVHPKTRAKGYAAR
jgi:hypothetical protein